MADSTVHALTDGAAPAATDEFYVTRTPFGAGNDRKLTWAEVLAGVNIYLQGYGTVDPTGVADNSSIITAAETAAIAAKGAVEVPAGVFNAASISAASLNGPYRGSGQIKTSDGNKRGRFFNAVKSQPTTLAYPGTGIDDAFNGTLTNVPFVVEQRVTGADTLGSVAQTSGVPAKGVNALNSATINVASGVTVNGVNALNSTTINVNSSPITAGYSSTGGYAYLAGIAFKYTGLTSSSFTGCSGHAATTGGESIDCSPVSAGFAASGTAYLAGTAFTYTGLTSSSFTGCGNHAATVGGETIKSMSAPYMEVAEAGPYLGYFSNSSGRSGVGSVGRTGIGFHHLRLKQETSAGGDLAGLWVDAIASGTTPGATRWDQNSSVGVLAGGLAAGADGVYIDPDELQLASGVNLGGATVTIASPAVVTLNNHGRVVGDAVTFATTGALPTGLTAGTVYYVIAAGLTANAFEVSTSSGGSAVNTSGSQSGFHTLYSAYDATVVGLIRNFSRRNDTGAIGQFYNGVRLQSVGDATHGNVDVGFMAYGASSGYMVGIDLSAANLQNSGGYALAAITMKANQCIYFDASGSDAGGLGFYRRPDSTGTTFFRYNSGGSYLESVVGGTSAFQVSATQVTVNANLSVTDGKALIAGSTSGLKIASATTQKIGFFNATPVVQEAGSNDILASLVTLGLRAASSNPPLDMGTGTLSVGSIVLADGHNIAGGTSTGTIIGGTTSQKIGFWGTGGIVKPTTSTSAATIVNGSGTAGKQDDTYDGYTVAKVVKALRNMGLLT